MSNYQKSDYIGLKFIDWNVIDGVGGLLNVFTAKKSYYNYTYMKSLFNDEIPINSEATDIRASYVCNQFKPGGHDGR